MGTGSFLGVKREGRGADHPPQSRAEVKERLQLYLYTPLGLRGLFSGELYLYLYRHPMESMTNPLFCHRIRDNRICTNDAISHEYQKWKEAVQNGKMHKRRRFIRTELEHYFEG
jgi:delta 1-pyrroline-5-carboxylate dehydrogenase